ncbi:unnamed protein product, partial [Discosporangium mesarthrocarpum]
FEGRIATRPFLGINRDRMWERGIVKHQNQGPSLASRSLSLRGGGEGGGFPATIQRGLSHAGIESGRRWKESEPLLAGKVKRIAYLRKREPYKLQHVLSLGVASMVLRRVLATVGQPRSRALNRLMMDSTLSGRKITEEDIEDLPFVYLPSVGSTMLLIGVVAARVLFLLGRRWSVGFESRVSYTEVEGWEAADAVLVEPCEPSGPPVICPIVRSRAGAGARAGVGEEGRDELDEGMANGEVDNEEGEEEGKKDGPGEVERGGVGDTRPVEHPYFIHQRRKFVLQEGSRADLPGSRADGLVGGNKEREADTFGLVELPVGWEINRYLHVEGLSGDQVQAAKVLYGSNKVEVKPMTLFQSLSDRLLSPFVIFRVFVQVLWMVEMYWSRAMFQLGETFLNEVFFTVEAETLSRQLKRANALKPKTSVRAWRGGKWVSTDVEGLVPGDVISLKSRPRPRKHSQGHNPNSNPAGTVEGRGNGKDGGKDNSGDGDDDALIGGGVEGVMDLPADVVVLRGTAIVDEAMLTGESVPQIKTSLLSEAFEAGETLDMREKHRGHVLYSGTALLDHFPGEELPIPGWRLPRSTPDGGCLCFVLRTGFYSFQGDLRRMIDYGSDSFIGNESKDSALVLLLLLSFAGTAASYVVHKGLSSGTKSGFQLLVQCVRILTSVVPTTLHTEMSQCVNNAMRNLLSAESLHCTEPFRIPLAGKVDICLFDKTGTITSDRLIAETLTTTNDANPGELPMQTPLSGEGQGGGGGGRAELVAKVVLGGCHSLIEVGGSLRGDPLEVSALEGINWTWDNNGRVARPAPATPSSNNSTTSASDAGGEEGKGERGGEGEGEGEGAPSVHVWRRYPFSSQLQRMSAVAEVQGLGRDGRPEVWCLTKGSPESLFPLLNQASVPAWYASEYRRLARGGRRVIALAYRSLGTLGGGKETGREELQSASRGEVEGEGEGEGGQGCLVFAGLISFHCKTRTDSREVIHELRRRAGCLVTVVTGDSVLTAAHVSQEVGVLGEPEEGKG